MNSKQTLAVFTVLLSVTLVLGAVTPAEAIRGSGVSLSVTSSSGICGNTTCEQPMTNEEKIQQYLDSLTIQDSQQNTSLDVDAVIAEIAELSQRLQALQEMITGVQQTGLIVDEGIESVTQGDDGTAFGFGGTLSAKIGTKEIADRAITMKKIAPGAVTTGKIADGTITFNDLSTNVFNVYAISQTLEVDYNDDGLLRVSCNPGDVVLSGGWHVDELFATTGDYVYGSYPSDLNEWTIHWGNYDRNLVFDPTDTIDVIILCLTRP